MWFRSLFRLFKFFSCARISVGRDYCKLCIILKELWLWSFKFSNFLIFFLLCSEIVRKMLIEFKFVGLRSLCHGKIFSCTRLVCVLLIFIFIWNFLCSRLANSNELLHFLSLTLVCQRQQVFGLIPLQRMCRNVEFSSTSSSSHSFIFSHNFHLTLCVGKEQSIRIIRIILCVQ